MRKLVSRLMIGWLIVFVCFAVWHHLAYGPRTRLKVPELQAHSSRIAAPVEDHLLSERTTSKSGQALVDRQYVSRLDYAALRSHYDAQLAAVGWTFQGETPLRDWGRDFGGRIAQYRRGEDCASLQYAGERAQYGWSYALSFTWEWTGCDD